MPSKGPLESFPLPICPYSSEKYKVMSMYCGYLQMRTRKVRLNQICTMYETWKKTQCNGLEALLTTKARNNQLFSSENAIDMNGDVSSEDE